MNKIEIHIKHLFRDIPESDRKNQIMQEITQDLNDKVRDLIASGKSEEDAVNKAIVDFGDIDEIKTELGLKAQGGKSKNARLNLGFSIWGSAITIGLFLFINFYYTPHIIWFVYPTFGILWWPITMYFHWLRKKKEEEELE